ncbi:hypothetical protein FNJ84_16265 [Paracoccus sp. M683]|uniref:hypothetical protein n=1 Tax=Paracoccus sp. M683 TaxID=2594268 RepID=UPI00117FD9D0|nr:hypothetical protein [Paracoccus sp. M683]TRW95281.1 hypothetical protein FNJ84_16265 [Paracoccus sp. M683]
MDQHYKSDKGFGPLQFGMTRDEVVAIIGAPVRQQSFDPAQAAAPDALMATIENAGVEGADEFVAQIYKGQAFDEYNTGEGEKSTQAPAWLSYVTYFHGSLSAIAVYDYPDKVYVGGVDINDRTPMEVALSLLEISDNAYEETSYMYFPDLGVKLFVEPEASGPNIFLDGRTEEALFDADEYSRVEKDDVIEYLSSLEDED